MSITTILFDLDETLVPDEETTRAALASACAPLEERHGVLATELAATVQRTARELWQAGPAIAYCRAIGIASWEGLWGDCSGADPNLALLMEWLPGYRAAAWRMALT
jgi:putative hydrolase of the HAD superfamily